jgi:hypothetical protein
MSTSIGMADSRGFTEYESPNILNDKIMAMNGVSPSNYRAWLQAHGPLKLPLVNAASDGTIRVVYS